MSEEGTLSDLDLITETEKKLHWGLLLFPDIRKAFYLIKNCVCLGEQSLHRECDHGRSLNRA